MPTVVIADEAAYKGGTSLMARYAFAVRYIAEHHAAAFGAYWEEHWPGKAKGAEFLAANDQLADSLMIVRRPA